MSTEPGFSRQRVLILCGYFDEFSGYNEVVLARALSKKVDLTVFAGDEVSPVFTDPALDRIGMNRRYPLGDQLGGKFRVRRFATRRFANLLWPRSLHRALGDGDWDLIVQLSPGQLFPFFGSFRPSGVSRIILFPDNTQMTSHVTAWKRRLKKLLFAASKGVAYRVMAARADQVFATTPDGQELIRSHVRREVGLIPLAYDEQQFCFDPSRRSATRRRFELDDDEVAILIPGKLAAEKGLESALQAFDRLDPVLEGKKNRLLITGFDNSDYAKTLSNSIRVMRRRSDVMELPFLTADELADVFNAADVGLWPRNAAITIQQALGTGLFALLPDEKTVSHLIQGETGRYFEPGELTSARLEECLLASDFRAEIRLARAEQNRWLSSAGVAAGMLEELR